ncbi:MAG: hypothetical protein EHM35_19590 [Planctomycetaceae bacterium]|nr:MAG: hypothetical protein EHM35_19590 [Planctomycetaceae bacterium]
MTSLKLFRDHARHRAPEPTRYTQGASLRARALGSLYRLFASQDPEPNASEHACGPVCHPDHPVHQPCVSGAYEVCYGVQRGKQGC